MTTVAIAMPLATLVALVAWRLRTLTRSGALSAILVGTITMGIGGWPAAAVLFAFFGPSVVLSRLGRAQKRLLTDIGKHGPRNAMQVLANGGIATLSIALTALPHATSLASTAFAAAFATAAADTWGTEIGTLVRATPRHIFTWKPMGTGLSGGVTAVGTLAELCGAAVVASVAMLVGVGSFLPIMLAGFAGAMIDSVLGATLQERRYCDACRRSCEIDPHDCGLRTRVIGGVRGITNDVVNLGATASGALLGLLFAVLLP